MPMLTTSSNGLRVLPTMPPVRTDSANDNIRPRSGHDLPLDLGAADAGARRLAQCNVQHGPVLSEVDMVATPHCSGALFETDCVRKLKQLCEHHFIDTLAREIDVQADRLARESLESARIAREQFGRVHAMQARSM